MNPIIERIKEEQIIAIVRGISEDKIIETCKALFEGGVGMIEVTFDQSSPTGIEDTCKAIRLISDRLPEICVGAGTVMTEEQVEKAVESGAKYIISPNIDQAVIKKTLACDAVSIPGALTPTEVADAYALGAHFVKLFPAGNLGLGYIKALMAPINHIPLLAVGGVGPDNLADFLDIGLTGVGVGSSLVNKKLIETGKFDELRSLARTFSDKRKGDK